MPVIRNAESRRTETPNAIMTTLASPTQGRAGSAVWRVDMRPGQAGPLHAMDREQIWTVLEGRARVLLGADTVEVGPGDTLVLPPDLPRQLTAGPETGVVLIGVAPAGIRAYVRDSAAVDANVAVPDQDKLRPAWVA
jgi:quercetin dioxygenase-like cupin family protein